ncbi:MULTISPECIES: extracellular solute-binding protein [Virgibacillus]|uniref:Extracellular solute-binding protein n=1 Tax=Virgibacillus dokdonensis TaxID=302167 RepID=A0A2K9J535_9BACI|nr:MULTISPECIES: extracellular solute-binding protein [Virgibacillus]AUJ24090.1 Lipoprotein LipO precursor [Virgibacillus dokdonensis]NWO15158.1 extracellular solute-binding protein [Virgibacillus sp.]
MKWKLCCLFVIVIVMFLSACSEDNKEANGKKREEAIANLSEEGMPIVEEEITIEVFSGQAATTAEDWNDVPMLNEYEKMTNIDMQWEQVAIDGLAEKRNLTLASGDLPDLFYGTYLPNADVYKYGKQGVLIPLNDFIDEYAPNIKKYLETYPEIKQGITFPDGNIYAIPRLRDPNSPTSLMDDKPWINKDILEEVGMDNPETTEEFYTYLKAAKDLSVEGKEVIPFSSVSMDRLYHLISGAFGVSNKGIMHRLIDEDPETGEIRFYRIAEEYKQMLEYMNKLYTEGLIEQNIYSIEVDQFLANGMEGRYAAMNFFNPIDYFGEEVGGRYIPGNALEGPNGDKMFTAVLSPVNSLGHFSITNVNENPEATLRWLDYFWSEQGKKMFFMGLEGETYEETAEGPKLLEEITNNPNGLTIQEALANYIINPGGGHPVLDDPRYSTAPEFRPEDIENAEQNEPYLIDEPWPMFFYEDDEQSRLDALATDLSKYVGEMEAQFVTGETSFAEWDNYVQTMKEMGLDEYMEIQQKALDRYLGK